MVAELALKSVCGGALVLAFALFAQTLSPKRFAGVFAAAPTVALASLAVTVAFKGSAQAARACTGMLAGAAGFAVYCLLAPTALRRLGTLRGSTVTLLAWAATAALVLPAVMTLPAAKGAAVLPAGRPRPAVRQRPRLGVQFGKIAQSKPREATVRFGFGAGASLLAGVVSVTAGPVVGGAFLAFPAILLASLTLVADEEGQAAARDDARGAAAGALGLLAFAALGAALFGTVAAIEAFGAAVAGWLVVALAAYFTAWWAGRGGDE
jgi:uncharacterized membrane protein (GlpM family)